jgi:hypothetical protein
MSIRKAATASVSLSGGGGGTSIPVGPVAERPQNANIGDLYFNTTHDTLEQYTRSGWQKTYEKVAMALRMNKMELM